MYTNLMKEMDDAREYADEEYFTSLEETKDKETIEEYFYDQEEDMKEILKTESEKFEQSFHDEFDYHVTMVLGDELIVQNAKEQLTKFLVKRFFNQ